MNNLILQFNNHPPSAHPAKAASLIDVIAHALSKVNRIVLTVEQQWPLLMHVELGSDKDGGFSRLSLKHDTVTLGRSAERQLSVLVRHDKWDFLHFTIIYETFVEKTNHTERARFEYRADPCRLARYLSINEAGIDAMRPDIVRWLTKGELPDHSAGSITYKMNASLTA